MEFNSARLAMARRRRGLSKKDLSKDARISTRMLRDYESALAVPSNETIERLATALHFPVDFFYRPDPPDVPLDGISFRALSRLPANKRDQAISAAAIALELDDWISDRYTLPTPALPMLAGVDAETASLAIREQWGLGERPIANVVHLLEAKGVRVFSLAEKYAEVDAFSFWRDGTPYIFLNTFKSADRARFDASHELGHLCMHWRHEVPRGRDYENEADAFSSSFLMPRASILASAPKNPTLDVLIQAKRGWKVSSVALAYRMHKLGLMSDWQYRSVHIELARRGFSTSEPDEIQRESSQVLGQVFADQRSSGKTVKAIASELAVHPQDIRENTFGFVQRVTKEVEPSASDDGHRNDGPPKLTLI